MTGSRVRRPHLLVLAKAPVAGRVKTRLGKDIGMESAAELAAAALIDTIDACTEFHREGCFLAVDGSLREAVRGQELQARLGTWTVFAQVGDGFAERLAAAHAQVPGPVVQLGMDTPQITAGDLGAVAAGLADHDSVLAPAADGGWWALALRDPANAQVVRRVEMSTDHTYQDTRRALLDVGLAVARAHSLIDVDTLADAELVARTSSGAFARAWARQQDRLSA